jgi:hypothetical protein
MFRDRFTHPMADPNEPKKETVRIVLPSQSVTKEPSLTTKSRETVRIQLPLRPPSNKFPPLDEPSTAPKPPPEAVVPPQLSSLPPSSSPTSPPVVSAPGPTPAVAPVSPTPDSLFPGPNKETARIQLMPDPPVRPAPTIQMKKTQPLIAMPESIPQSASIAVAPTEKRAGLDTTPMSICWLLLCVSAVILILQIWIYIS